MRPEDLLARLEAGYAYDPMYGQLCNERDQLKAENAKLREQVERLHADQAHWELGNCPSCPNVADLQEALAENAKLRELVRGMYKAFMHGNCYRWCEFKEPCNYILDGKCQWYDRARELGIEVTA